MYFISFLLSEKQKDLSRLLEQQHKIVDASISISPPNIFVLFLIVDWRWIFVGTEMNTGSNPLERQLGMRKDKKTQNECSYYETNYVNRHWAREGTTIKCEGYNTFVYNTNKSSVPSCEIRELRTHTHTRPNDWVWLNAWCYTHSHDHMLSFRVPVNTDLEFPINAGEETRPQIYAHVDIVNVGFHLVTWFLFFSSFFVGFWYVVLSEVFV